MSTSSTALAALIIRGERQRRKLAPRKAEKESHASIEAETWRDTATPQRMPRALARTRSLEDATNTASFEKEPTLPRLVFFLDFAPQNYQVIHFCHPRYPVWHILLAALGGGEGKRKERPVSGILVNIYHPALGGQLIRSDLQCNYSQHWGGI